MSFYKRSWAAIMIGLLTLFVSACGDSNDFNDISGQQGNNNGGQNLIFPGRYLGANNLDGGQTAVLDLTVNNNGQATGTVTVADPVVMQAIDIDPGVYNLTGSVNLTTGTFNLSGTFPGIGAFTIVGTLPVGNAQGNYVMTINGQTFAGLIQNANLGTPTPPNNGGGNDGDERLIFGGELLGFTFSPDGSYNGVNPPVDTDSLITGAVVINSDTQNVVNIIVSEVAGAQIRALTFGVITQNGEDLVVGETYPIITSQNETGSLISLSESTGTTVNRAWIGTTGTTGSVTIVALDANGVELDFNFSNVVPNTGVSGNTATGSFSTSGTVVADFAPGL
jgi:hypothetical protein